VEVAELKRVMGGNDVVTDALIGEYDASGDGATCYFALNHLERSLISSNLMISMELLNIIDLNSFFEYH
jgi:hypothetical protein